MEKPKKKHEVCNYCDKQIKTKKSLTKVFWGYAHSRCHKAKINLIIKQQMYTACA